ncbi:hypothetical protein AXG93_3756s1140 [Marchantia polymorpha subsp. ruderalis]|uniref:SET domain-containing protein n=1 Tax=Marchantia polymorpha subsp. ruderalis TaxID=1480154 RepID=A0A176VF81_MARPO|nr:hypothetical protein AXG93_3756s1140 [Marchantia polymorpha subsp. ruderalis]
MAAEQSAGERSAGLMNARASDRAMDGSIDRWARAGAEFRYEDGDWSDWRGGRGGEAEAEDEDEEQSDDDSLEAAAGRESECLPTSPGELRLIAAPFAGFLVWTACAWNSLRGISNGVEDTGGAGKVSRGSERELKSHKRETKETMWGTLSRARRSMICLPHPTAVCSNVRTRIAGPIVQVQPVSYKEQVEFLDWLKERGQRDAYLSTTVGISTHGRALFATRPIQAGERVLRVSRDLLITPDKLPKEVTKLLPQDVSEWARLALFLLAEQHKGQESTWSPYISCLPPLGAIHSTVFWKKEELELVRHSSLHRETVQRKAIIGAEFAAVQPVPFVDFFNHESYCQALLSYDEEQGYAEVIADRDYAVGSQVVLSYGRLPNSILALDFGFTLPENPHDQVEVWMGVSRRDELRKLKLQLLHAHDMPTFLHADGSDSGGSGFNIRFVKSAIGRGKGIPHALRAFARVLCVDNAQELTEMAAEATKLDGRLARRPLKDKNREAQAMSLLLARLESMMQQRHSALLTLRLVETCRGSNSGSKSPVTVHVHMAGAVVSGEMRVLRSAIAWLRNHCSPSTVLT